jgi:hypothetical protein
MKMFVAVAVLMLAAAWPQAAGAQTPAERIQAARERAAAAGIPVSLLETKIAEGRAKGVPMDRIAGAVERREQALARANRALGGQRAVASMELGVAADAVESGVTESMLSALAGAAPQDRRALAFATLDQLVRSGQEPAAALEQVRAALGGGAEALMNLAGMAHGAGRPAGAPPADGTGPHGPRGTGEGAGTGPHGPRPGAPGAGAPAGRPAGPPAGPPAGMLPAPGQHPQGAKPMGRRGGS